MTRIAPFLKELAELVDGIEQRGHRVSELDPVAWIDTLEDGYMTAQLTIGITAETTPPATETPTVGAPAAKPLANGDARLVEDVAPDDMMAFIGYARDIATFQEALLDFYEVAVEFEETRADAQAFGDDEQHERAVEEYEAAKDPLDDARSQLDGVESAHEPIAAESFDEIDLEYRGEYTQYVEGEGPGSIDAQELLIDGQLNVHQMFVELNGGFERYENEEFVAARERITAGDEARQRAAESFEAAQEHDFAWEGLREESIGYLGIVEDLAEAFALFIDATHEGEARNLQEANELAEEGFFVLEQAFQ